MTRMVRARPWRGGAAVFGLWLCALAGCKTTEPVTEAPVHPSVAPQEPVASGDRLSLDPSVLSPMYHQILAIDLPGAARVAAAQNIDIRQARLAVTAQQGRVDSAFGQWFPAIVPGAVFDLADGGVRATQGNIVEAGFQTFFAFLAIDWVLNPGQVHYDVVAAKKRLAASEHEERAVVLGTLHDAVIQFYDLALAQSDLSTARRAVSAAEELLRINELKLQAGTGVHADRMRAEAHLAEQRQNQTLALARFYRASVRLAVTLRLDATVTLAPSTKELPPTTLVRADLNVEQLLALAVEFRPDLESIRAVVEAVAAETKSEAWGGFGPQFRTAYSVGGIEGHFRNPGGVVGEDGFQLQQRFAAGGGWRLSMSTFGDLRTAEAVEQQTLLEAERLLDTVRAQVVNAQQAIRANRELIQLARHGVEAAREALRLAEANLRTGTMTTLEVLEAQDALARAEFRHARAVVGYNQSQADLLAALGLMDMESLGVSALAPEHPEPAPAAAPS